MSRNLPRRDSEFDTKGFTEWLIGNRRAGSNKMLMLLAPTNEWEVFRYRIGKSTNIVYRKKSGALTYCGNSGLDYADFLGHKWQDPNVLDLGQFPRLTPLHEMQAKYRAQPAQPASPVFTERHDRIRPNRQDRRMGAAERAVIRTALMKRDGTECWLCGEHMGPTSRSIEHLDPHSQEGSDDLENLVLTHPGCNLMLKNLPRARKEALRQVYNNHLYQPKAE